ncbi:MAG: TonB-dependent receptor plug domain-containing protein [Bacteroidia bacterium]|nr:TonB-dependent receptor plug domain-containing protein [Bacteroidia bacterium]
MKTIALILLLSALALVSSCTSSGAVAQDASSNLRDTPAATMADLLRRQPNLQVSGSGENIQLQIRGQNTMMTSTEPMIVVDGYRVGSGYAAIQSINPADVARINIIRDPGQLAGYGLGAANGVIEIHLVK